MHKVELTYFKQSGKFYSEGCYHSDKTNLWEIWDEVRNLVKNKELPGLVKGDYNFYITITVPSHEHNHPHLIIPND